MTLILHVKVAVAGAVSIVWCVLLGMRTSERGLKRSNDWFDRRKVNLIQRNPSLTSLMLDQGLAWPFCTDVADLIFIPEPNSPCPSVTLLCCWFYLSWAVRQWHSADVVSFFFGSNLNSSTDCSWWMLFRLLASVGYTSFLLAVEPDTVSREREEMFISTV